jgi:hypothetical protein
VEVSEISTVDERDESRPGGGHGRGEVVDRAGVDHVVTQRPKLASDRKLVRFGWHNGSDEERGRQRHHLMSGRNGSS